MSDQQEESGREGNGMRIAKSVKAAAATAVASAAAVIGLSAPADAALKGPLHDSSGADTNYSNENFLISGLGTGQMAANNAVSVDNENNVVRTQGYTWSN
ncbi:hypothetical protein RB200_06600 [Streptomyces sp. PmtG]